MAFIGDSLTQWYDWEGRFPEDKIVNLGISGETVEGLLNRRDRIRSQIGEPDYIFLMTGINNIANGQYGIAVSYNEVVRNLTTWFKRTRVVVQSILPIELSWISNTAIINANHEIALIAREHGADYLDLFSLFMDSNDHPKKGLLSDDGVHLAAKGYEVWANEVERFIATHTRS
jgi:lysophospholipase L1-like esterase